MRKSWGDGATRLAIFRILVGLTRAFHCAGARESKKIFNLMAPFRFDFRIYCQETVSLIQLRNARRNGKIRPRMVEPDNEVTQLLFAWSQGDEEALDRLMPLVVDELRRIAKRYLDRESPVHTLQPTALVNEVYLRFTDQRSVDWKNRAQFFGFTAQMMRHILVDHARGRQAGKRGDGIRPLSLDEVSDLPEERDRGLIALDDALKYLAEVDERQSRIVELRYFAGLTNEEVARTLEISVRTVKREWHTARLWLHQEIQSQANGTGEVAP